MTKKKKQPMVRAQMRTATVDNGRAGMTSSRSEKPAVSLPAEQQKKVRTD